MNQVKTTERGRVKFFNDEKGFGFITPESGKKDIFVHKSGTRGFIQEDDEVEYEVAEGDRGLYAKNVAVL